MKNISWVFFLLVLVVIVWGRWGHNKEEKESVLKTCPDDFGSFIPVPGNSYFGTTDFCVMKFEAKNVEGVAFSQASKAPWVNMNAIDSKTEFRSLGYGYDLISNSEWMTIAHNVENVSENWSGGSPGSGMLNRGHSDGNPNNALEVTDEGNSYNGTGNDSGQAPGSGWEQKRTHTLSNGEEIWDISGNVWSWVDWSEKEHLTDGPIDCDNNWEEIPSIKDQDNCSLLARDYLPSNPEGIDGLRYNADYGLGRIYGGFGGAARRGGHWANEFFAGVFSLVLFNSSGEMSTFVGFRCVFRPH